MTPSNASSHSRRALPAAPPHLPRPAVADPAAPPAASDSFAAPLPKFAVSRSATEKCIPVYVPQPGEENLAAHAIETDPAYRPTATAAPAAAAGREAQAARSQLRWEREVAAAWAALPVLVWGGLTLAGLVLHLRLAAAALVLVLTALGAWLPFANRHRLLPLGVLVGLIAALTGPWLLAGVGEILTVPAWRAFTAADTPLGLRQVGNRVNDWLCAAGLILAWLLSIASFVRGATFAVRWLLAWQRRTSAAAATVAAPSTAAWPLRLQRAQSRLRQWLGWKD